MMMMMKKGRTRTRQGRLGRLPSPRRRPPKGPRPHECQCRENPKPNDNNYDNDKPWSMPSREVRLLGFILESFPRKALGRRLPSTITGRTTPPPFNPLCRKPRPKPTSRPIIPTWSALTAATRPRDGCRRPRGLLILLLPIHPSCILNDHADPDPPPPHHHPQPATTNDVGRFQGRRRRRTMTFSSQLPLLLRQQLLLQLLQQPQRLPRTGMMRLLPVRVTPTRMVRTPTPWTPTMAQRVRVKRVRVVGLTIADGVGVTAQRRQWNGLPS